MPVSARRVGTSVLVTGLWTLLAGCARGPDFKAMLPGVSWDRRAGDVAVDGAVCLERGILEYIAVAAGGKEYESAFRLHCRPAHLQQVLLMADYQPGEVLEDARGDFAPGSAAARPSGAPQAARPPEGYWEKAPAEGTRVEIDVEIEQSDGHWEQWPIEHFLTDRSTDAAPRRLQWVFTGSFFLDGDADQDARFAADATLSVIALWYDPSALLNLVDDVGNPYRGQTVGLELNPDALPPRNTPVRLILRPVRAQR